MKQVAGELGVGYVVEGSVRKAGDRVPSPCRSQRCHRHTSGPSATTAALPIALFAVQDEITEAIVAAIEPQLYAAENFHALRRPIAWTPGIW